ncbi:serine/threonine-protein kinase ULK3-like [Phlebotomus papatasi]|uniref:serine/threonine-protein kinase ULK3-like n=1 Tax=Phlebotomus papatasi TaxID=29031 RepID=UPI00248432A1|nr:serine/threonine-protein kinase ULK3-like [Phlebotomus papatasi]
MAVPKITDYEMLEKLGSGSYATVYRCQKKATKEIFAVKCVEKNKLTRSSLDNLVTEIRLLRRLKHRHIVEMHDFLYDDKNIYILMEFCNSGSLSSFIKRRNVLPETTCRFFLRQLALALEYMRSNNVSHFDLKPQNLLLSKTPLVLLKVADFGFAQHLEWGQENTTIKGSPLYMAPEILLRNCYDCKADLWSIGVILYECLFGKAPYSSKSLPELLEKIRQKQRIDIPRNTRISPECEDLLTRLLQHDRDKRIDFKDFFQHDFLDLRHAPSEENFERALEIVREAVDADNKGEFERAYHLYCESLQFFVPYIQAEQDVAKKQALRARVRTYMHRAEEIKHAVSGEKAPAQNPVHNALTPRLLYQQLHSLSHSSPILKDSLEMGRQGELYAHEGKYQAALESLKSSLGGLVPALGHEPKGQRRDLLHQQIQTWMKEAESLKSLLSAQDMQEDKDSQNSITQTHCCIQ